MIHSHLHLTVSSVERARAFWVETLGLTPHPVAASVYRLPGALVVLSKGLPAGGSKGTTVNHLGFRVPDIRRMLEKVRKAGHALVTRAELPDRYEVKDDLALIPDLATEVAFVMAPDETKVEFIEERGMADAIDVHHIHFAAADVLAMRAWYEQALGATPRRRGSFESADLPGVNLSFSPAPGPVLGTRDRAVHRIGFEVPDLELLCGHLKRGGIETGEDVRQAKELGAVAAACLTDPWGTQIVLTEGIDQIE